ncbi:MAG: hypothetical protein R2836_05370 [Chitinophagales bacterium]|nr:hypothetical protein [Bacteroidota bacterium]MCB9226759.1 hypothetical protein [Chitinophagales bacterium]
MKIQYTTKEESNYMQEQEFLALKPVERIYAFLRLSEKLKDFPSKKEVEKKDNFLIIINTN